MSDEISARHVDKFNGENFQVWKFQMKAVFTAYGIIDIVDGTRMKPQEPTSPHTKQWIKDDAKAKFIISSSMEPRQMESLLVCETASQMWTKLSAIHEQKSATNKLILTQKFHEYRMDPSDSVVQHVAKVQNMAMKLTDLGENVSPVAIMAKIIASLPAKFNALKTAWDSVAIADQTVDNLTERLIKEELRLTFEDESTTALAATTYRGNKKIHKSNERNDEAREKGHSKDKRDVECFACKKKGHYARECRKTKSDNKKQKQSSYNRSFSAFLVNSEKRERGQNSTSDIVELQADYQAPSKERGEELLQKSVSDVWLIDSGASKHITYRREWFTEYRECENENVSLGDDGECEVHGTGTIEIEKLINGKWFEARIENVLYVPRVKKNLLSTGTCTAKGYSVYFERDKVLMIRNGTVEANGIKQDNNIYRMFFRVKSTQTRSEANVADLRTWHERLGHVSKKTLQEMVEKNIVHGIRMSEVDDFFCESCQLGKAHRLKFGQSVVQMVRQPGDLIHSDVCGPMSVNSLGGARYYVNFKDDASGFRHVYFIKHKSDVFDRFKEYEAMIQNKFGRSIQILRTDNGREYCNNGMKRYLAERGIQHETTAPFTPEQNGKAERDNRTIVESARSMLQAKDLPKFLWAEAVNTAVYILNCITAKQNSNTTPFEIWTGKKPNLSHLRIFGSPAYIHVPKQFRTKLDAKAKKVTLVGYQCESKNYRLYDPQTKRVTVSRDVIFNEEATTELTSPQDNREFNFRSSNSNGETVEEEEDNRQIVLEEDRSALQSATESRNLRDRTLIRKPARYELNIAEYDIPKTVEEAMMSPDAQKWTEAIREELKSHKENGTWTIVRKETSHIPIDSRWVFKILKDTDDRIYRYKARLCARGYKQQPGLDYTETFSPVLRYDSLRIFLAIVTQLDLELIQFDVKTAFLHGELKEDIFMEIPEGLKVNCKNSEMVCKLNKSLYGLKQAPRCWNKKFCEFLAKVQLRASDADQCIFSGIYMEETIYLALFVDDGLLAAKSKRVLDLVVKLFSESFDITIGDAHYFAGIEIQRDRDKKTTFIHQTAYVKRILEKFQMNKANNVSVPADPNAPLSSSDDENVINKNVMYREAVGSLIFLATVSRPDIAFAVNVVSRYLNKHSMSHWRAVTRIMRYLIGTKSYGIMYEKGGSVSQLIGYSDSDYASDLDTRRSTTGYAFEFVGGLITWSSQRQKIVTLSTTEAEYVAIATASKEAVWIRALLNSLSLLSNSPTILYVDNQSAIRLSRNPEFHKRTKHIDIKYHYIREKIESQEIDVKYIHTNEQRADLLTKPLSRDRFRYLCSLINLVMQ